MRFVSTVLRKMFQNHQASNSPAMFEVLENRRLMSATIAPVAVRPQPIMPPVTIIPMVHSIGVTIHSEAGERFFGVVGKVKGLNTITSDLKSLKVVVKWGDGSALGTGMLSLDHDGDVVLVSAAHTYAKSGNYAITITIESTPPVVDPPIAIIAPLVFATIHSDANITPDHEGGVHLVEVATQKFTAKLGTFDFVNVDLRLRATITWGDGTTSEGTVQRNGTDFDDWAVFGTHTYAKTGLYNVHVGVTGTPFGAPGEPTPQFILLIPDAQFDSVIDVKGKA